MLLTEAGHGIVLGDFVGSVLAGFAAFPWPTIFVLAAILTLLGGAWASMTRAKQSRLAPLVAMVLNSMLVSGLYGVGLLFGLVI